MNRSELLLAEFKKETVATRNILAKVPMDKLDYKPHEKSMSLRRLSTHVAEIAGWWKECVVDDELDFAKGDFTPKEFVTNDELLAYYDDLITTSEKILNEVSDEEFDKPWSMRQGEMIFFTQPKHEVVREWCLNHWYHHRAQLGVYLRMLDVPLPGTYGPSADSE